MRRSYRLSMLGAIAMAVASATRPAVGQDRSGSDLAALLNENVVTTASKSAETSTAAPGLSTSMTAEQLRRFGIRSLDEAIDFLSLGVVTANPLRDIDVGARGVMVTGDHGDHLLLLVNGHAVNEPLFGGAQFGRGAAIPMEMVDHIEVVIGPGSVLYGSSAMFVVINVITKRAQEFAGFHVLDEIEIGKSNRVAAGAGLQLGRNTDLTLQLDYYRQDGPVFSIGPQTFGVDPVSGVGTVTRRGGKPDGIWGGEAGSSYYAEVPAGHVRLSSGNFEVNLHASTYKRAAPYSAATSPYEGDFDAPDNYELDRSAWGDVRYTTLLSPVVQLTTRLYGDTFDSQHFFTESAAQSCVYGDRTPCLYHSLGMSRWAGVEVQSTFNWFANSTLVTLVGADGRYLGVRAKSDVQNAETLAYRASSSNIIDATEVVVGAYVQQTWTPAEWLVLNGGARIDASNRYDAVVSPRVASNVSLWPMGTFKLIYAEAFRAPSWNEAASQTSTLVRADDLQSERVRSVEGALEQKFGTHRLVFGVFRSWWRDLIELHKLTNAEYAEFAAAGRITSLRDFNQSQYRNISSIDGYGYDVTLEGLFAPGRLRYGLNGTAAFTREPDPVFGRSHAPEVTPQIFGNARISYDFSGGYPLVALAAQYMDRRPAARAFDGAFAVPPTAPAQLRLRLTVSGPIPILSGLSYRASADYAVADRAAYVIGRTVAGAPADLAPVDQFRASVGLQYDLLFRRETSR